jgi:hypothetical protein
MSVSTVSRIAKKLAEGDEPRVALTRGEHNTTLVREAGGGLGIS